MNIFQLKNISKENKDATIFALLIIFVFIAVFSAVKYFTLTRSSAEFRAQAEKELEFLISEYGRNPSIVRLEKIEERLSAFLLRAGSNGYDESELSDLGSINTVLSKALSEICSDSDCKTLSEKVEKYSAFVEKYSEESSKYNEGLKAAEKAGIVSARFICPSVAIELSDTYVFYCMANGMEPSYLSMLKSEYQSGDFSGYGLLINKVLPVKDNGPITARVNGVNTLIRAYIFSEMVEKTDFLEKYSDEDLSATKKALAVQAKYLNEARADGFINIYAKTRPAIEGLARYFKFKINFSNEPLKMKVTGFDGLLMDLYGPYSRSNECWMYSLGDNKASYCMKIISEEAISDNGRSLRAVALKGSVAKDAFLEKNNSNTLVGLFLFENNEPLTRISIKKDISINGRGEPDDFFVKIKKTGKDHYSWIMSYSYNDGGFKNSEMAIFPQHGGAYGEPLRLQSKSILENKFVESSAIPVTPDLEFGCIDCAAHDDYLTATVSVVPNEKESLYPVNIFVSGYKNGKPVKSKTAFVFDINGGVFSSANSINGNINNIIFNDD